MSKVKQILYWGDKLWSVCRYTKECLYSAKCNLM